MIEHITCTAGGGYGATLCAMFIKPGRGRWEAAACKLEDNVEVEEINREEEKVKVSTLRDGGGARGGGPSVHGGSIYQGRGEDEALSVPNSVAPFCVAQNRGALRVRHKTQGRAPGSSNASAV